MHLMKFSNCTIVLMVKDKSVRIHPIILQGKGGDFFLFCYNERSIRQHLYPHIEPCEYNAKYIANFKLNKHKQKQKMLYSHIVC